MPSVACRAALQQVTNNKKSIKDFAFAKLIKVSWRFKSVTVIKYSARLSAPPTMATDGLLFCPPELTVNTEK